MRSREEQRLPNISKESSQQREAMKPSGYAGAPSSSPAQVVLIHKIVEIAIEKGIKAPVHEDRAS